MGMPGAASFPVPGTGVPAQARRRVSRASAREASVGAGRSGRPSKGRIFVVVQSSTRYPASASSSPRVRRRVVLPPPPMTAVTPGRTSSSSAKPMTGPPIRCSFYRITSRRAAVKGGVRTGRPDGHVSMAGAFWKACGEGCAPGRRECPVCGCSPAGTERRALLCPGIGGEQGTGPPPRGSALKIRGRAGLEAPLTAAAEGAMMERHKKGGMRRV